MPGELTVRRNGGKTRHDIVVGYRRPDAPQACVSHFGEGVVTFNLGALFTTNPGWQLQIRGPVNCPKQGVSAPEGVVETEWLPFTSTMNWQVSEPGTWIQFRVGEPIATVVPVRLELLEAARVELLDLEDDAELETAHDAWAGSRQGFLDGLEAGKLRGWQKGYTRGVYPVSGPAPNHRTKPRLTEPLEAR